MKNTEWPPEVLFSVHPAFWYGIATAGTQKIHMTTFEELEFYLQQMRAADTPENRMAQARRALQFELDWYDQD